MNLTTRPQPVLRMTSIEIADLLEKRHDNVKRTIETLINKGVIGSPQIEAIPTATKPAIAYVFIGEQGKRDSIIVVAQLSAQFTARLVDRWQELERQAASQQFAIPQTMAEALRLAADLADKAHVLEYKVAEQAPKVQGFDRIANTSGTLTIRETAAALGVPERKFIDWLQQHDWLYRRVERGPLRAYAERVKAGLLACKTTAFYDPRTGIDQLRETVRVTSAGLAALARHVPRMLAA